MRENTRLEKGEKEQNEEPKREREREREREPREEILKLIYIPKVRCFQNDVPYVRNENTHANML